MNRFESLHHVVEFGRALTAIGQRLIAVVEPRFHTRRDIQTVGLLEPGEAIIFQDGERTFHHITIRSWPDGRDNVHRFIEPHGKVRVVESNQGIRIAPVDELQVRGQIIHR